MSVPKWIIEDRVAGSALASPFGMAKRNAILTELPTIDSRELDTACGGNIGSILSGVSSIISAAKSGKTQQAPPPEPQREASGAMNPMMMLMMTRLLDK